MRSLLADKVKTDISINQSDAEDGLGVPVLPVSAFPVRTGSGKVLLTCVYHNASRSQQSPQYLVGFVSSLNGQFLRTDHYHGV